MRASSKVIIRRFAISIAIRTYLLLLVLLLGISLILLGWSALARQGEKGLRVYFLDVGQGDAAVLATPSGRIFVVDTGRDNQETGEDMGREVVIPFFHVEGFTHIDALILTHPHADHIGGAATLLENLPCDALVDNGQSENSVEEAAYLAAAYRRHVPRIMPLPGEQIDCGDGVTLHFLAPTSAERSGPPNNASVVVRVDYGRTHFLLMGDAEAPEEATLLSEGQSLACDVLKVGHHGSDTSTTPRFLQAVHPKFAVISVGAYNLYGHPSPLVIERLRQAGIKIYRTDRNGAIEALSDGNEVRMVLLCSHTSH
ncbi:predicted hydrolase (metallo-beta-lactamase superfamily) [Chthonomonas calidirosea]|uniref:ComEC/Rec2 family competence protein n=1 Tax=Chthonomonas calidirosea TaxID=454171 RepID=UPI0006DD4455|nr:ComEC/Rec2 family competence protein [Chthonomonas calidirosea]CEK18337.1 predicted hydrolase (metallo-beta-lactamase superfamily) [Chthonomonas calidirosea]